jgi:hypothetical protein
MPSIDVPYGISLDSEIAFASAYIIKVKDHIDVLNTLLTFKNAHCLLPLPSLPSKTRETVFQVLNRTRLGQQQTFQILNDRGLEL